MHQGKKRDKKQKSTRPGTAPRRGNDRGKSHGKKGKGPQGIGDVSALIITEITQDGDLLAVPEEWNNRKHPPLIFITESQQGLSAGIGDRVLAKMRRTGAHEFHAKVIKLLPKETTRTVVGLFVPVAGGGGLIEPVSRKSKESFRVAKEDCNGAMAGELVKGTTITGGMSHGLLPVRIDERLGDARAPRAASLIAAHLHNLPSIFSEAALAEAEVAPLPVPAPGREDLRDIPLVTIDGEDARDFDDAVFAEADTDPKNPGGFHLLVAIADVAFYVKEQSALDADAFLRGNSAYFPDRVIPMLPERLSNGLCSLKPNEDRYCIAVHIWISAEGETLRYRFVCGLMRSHARLTYTQVEDAANLVEGEKTKQYIANLYEAYYALKKERNNRGTLEINLPEYKVQFDAAGNVEKIAAKPALKSHQLIESFMVAANVAAASFLIKHTAPGIYRVHESPSEDKLEELRKFLGMSGYSLPKGVITPVHLNRVLKQSENASNATMIHTTVLRSQMQAFYDGRNLGHFGLGLKQYCHFTSPIRRYADLVVHRSLAALLDADQKQKAAPDLKEIASHISETERTAMMAERDAMDRYKVSYMVAHKDKTFEGVVSSLNEHGLFVSLKGNGITGFIPVPLLGDDFFIYHKHSASFKGRQSNRSFTLGDQLTVRVMEADPLKGSLIFRPEGKPHKGRPEGKQHKNRPEGQAQKSRPDGTDKHTTKPGNRPKKRR